MVSNSVTKPSKLQRRLALHANLERRQVAEWYFKSEMKVLGVPTPELRKLAQEVHRETRSTSQEELLELCHSYIKTKIFEMRNLAYEVLALKPEIVTKLRMKQIEELGQGLDNWASVDLFASRLSGLAWRDGKLSTSRVKRWARSSNRWWRRVALVSTVALNRTSIGGKGNTPRTLTICEILVDDHDEMVSKGMSWALRDLSTVDPAATRKFLKKHQAALAARVRREVTNKLRTGLKSGRVKDKKKTSSNSRGQRKSAK